MAWDKDYERKAITLMAVGFGLVGLDRFIIMPLFPVISEDLGLTYQDLGLISGSLAFTWGLASVFGGNLTDRIGFKKILVVSSILFSILVATSGLATGLWTLVIIRGLMGLAEGGFVPASIIATIDAAKPSRKGLMVGVQQMSAPLVGLGLGPIVAVGLLAVLPGWEWVFAVVALPGFVLAWLLAKHIREPEIVVNKSSGAPRGSFWGSFRQAFRHRNVIFGTLGMVCFLSSLHTMSAFMPNYLTDHVGMSLERMGVVYAALGVGGVSGMLLLPFLSDRLGRKPVMVVSMVFAVLGVGLVLTGTTSAPVLALALFLLSSTISGVVSICIGPLINESVPITIAATATGLLGGLGEIFGGAIAPAVAGAVAVQQGIQVVPVIAIIAATLGMLIVIFGIQEPKPSAKSS